MRIKEFKDVVGHDSIKNLLVKNLEFDMLPNIIMFSGNPGIGKTTIAKILACEVAYKGSDKLEEMKDIFIEKCQDTNEVLLFNMSQMKSPEEVSKVKSSLSLGFSFTGRKVLVLDEAHGLTAEQQDSLLVSMENLPDNIYMFLCTTDTSQMRESFISRCKLNLRLKNLNQREILLVIENIINEKRLVFDGEKRFILTALSMISKNDSRRITALLENYPTGSRIGVNDLEVLMDTEEPEKAVRLLELMHTDYVTGLDFVNSYGLDIYSREILLKAVLSSLGVRNMLFNKNQTLRLTSLVKQYSDKFVIGFLRDISKSSRLTRNILVYSFINNAKKYLESYVENEFSAESNNLQYKSTHTSTVASNIYTPPDANVRSQVTAKSLDDFLRDCSDL